MKNGKSLLVTQTIEFSAAHKLYRDELSETENYSLFDKCANPAGHGHNYHLEATFAGPIDPQTGMVVHFNELKRMLRETVEIQMDHKNLNVDVAFLRGILPTSENVVRAIWEQICQTIAHKPYSLKKLKLSSSNHHWVEYGDIS